MRKKFRATEAGFEADKYCLLAAVMGCDESGEEHGLDLQRGPEDEDPIEDSGIYLGFDDQINGGYNHVGHCWLSRTSLSIDLAKPLRTMKEIEGFDIALDVEESSFTQLRDGLPRIFRGHEQLLSIS